MTSPVLENFYLYLLFCILTAVISTLPDFYALLKKRNAWVPVNLPPYMIGDDYHYFTLLNFIHRRFLNVFLGCKLEFPPLTANSRFQIIGFLFNLIPYHIGYLALDRRLGVLFVRLWNRFFLGLAFYYLSLSIHVSSRYPMPEMPEIMTSFLAFILLYPGPLNIGVKTSIVFNLNKNSHIYRGAHANDLFRAMFSETTAPFFLASLAFLIQACEVTVVPSSTVVIAGFVLCALFFHYPPAGAVFGALLFFAGAFIEDLHISAVSLFITGILVIAYVHFLRKDPIGKELFYHHDGGRFFVADLRTLVLVSSAVLPSLAISAYLISHQQALIGLIAILLSLFSVGHTLQKHQMSRFFDRAAAMPLQAIAVIYVFQADILAGEIDYLLPFFMIFVFFVFFCSQASYLFKNSATSLHNDLCRKLVEHDIFRKTAESRKIATDSPVIGGLIDLFSGDTSLLRNYSVQACGYLDHLDTVCLNYRSLGFSFEKFRDIACAHVSFSDWRPLRPVPQGGVAEDSCYRYSVQYIISNMDFNAKIIDDGHYSEIHGWTEKFVSVLATKYDRCQEVAGISVDRHIALHSDTLRVV